MKIFCMEHNFFGKVIKYTSNVEQNNEISNKQWTPRM